MTAISQQADVRLVDIERVESLPGPQGTLFGSSAQAGTIHYVTNKPDISGYSSEVVGRDRHDRGRRPELRRQRLGQHPAVATTSRCASSASGRKKAATSTTSLGTDADGRQTTNADVAEDDQNIYRTTGGRLAGLWTINENWNLLTTGIYQRGDTMGTWETDPFLGDNKVTRFFDEWRDDEWYTSVGDAQGRSRLCRAVADRVPTSTAGSTTSGTTPITPSGARYLLGPTRVLRLYDTGTLHSTTFNFQKQNRWAYEARLTSQGESKLQWMAGAFFEDVYDWWEYGAAGPGTARDHARLGQRPTQTCLRARRQPGPRGLPARADRPSITTTSTSNTVKQLAFFGEMTYDLTDKWSVTGGARWFEFDRDKFDLYQVPRGLPCESDPDANGLTSQSTDSDTTFKFSTQYQFTPDVMVYALYSEGFRLGGENSPRAADTGVVPLTYGPDYLSNYEAGIKSQWFDNRLLLNLLRLPHGVGRHPDPSR